MGYYLIDIIVGIHGIPCEGRKFEIMGRIGLRDWSEQSQPNPECRIHSPDANPPRSLVFSAHREPPRRRHNPKPTFHRDNKVLLNRNRHKHQPHLIRQHQHIFNELNRINLGTGPRHRNQRPEQIEKYQHDLENADADPRRADEDHIEADQ